MDKPGVLVGRIVTVKAVEVQPDYFTDVHRAAIGQRGRVHAIVPTSDRDDPLVKVGFDDGTRIVFYRLADLDVDPDAPLPEPRKHGERASHLPKLG
jgi:hypothetical protein